MDNFSIILIHFCEIDNQKVKNSYYFFIGFLNVFHYRGMLLDGRAAVGEFRIASHYILKPQSTPESAIL